MKPYILKLSTSRKPLRTLSSRQRMRIKSEIRNNLRKYYERNKVARDTKPDNIRDLQNIPSSSTAECNSFFNNAD